MLREQRPYREIQTTSRASTAVCKACCLSASNLLTCHFSVPHTYLNHSLFSLCSLLTDISLCWSICFWLCPPWSCSNMRSNFPHSSPVPFTFCALRWGSHPALQCRHRLSCFCFQAKEGCPRISLSSLCVPRSFTTAGHGAHHCLFAAPPVTLLAPYSPSQTPDL